MYVCMCLLCACAYACCFMIEWLRAVCVYGMDVCLYVCPYVMCVIMHVCLQVCECMCVCVCMHICLYVYVMYARMYVSSLCIRSVVCVWCM